MDTNNKLEKKDSSDIQLKLVENQENIYKYLSELLPWWNSSDISEKSLNSMTENSIKEYLDGFYLFPLEEISISYKTENISKFINERYQAILSASYLAGVTVATIITGTTKGSIKISLGFYSKNGSPEYYKSLLNGIYPGKAIDFKIDLRFSILLEGFSYGGLITGIPKLKNEQDSLQFNISSTIRSMYSKEYTLVIIAKPLDKSNLQDKLSKIINIRDKCHSIANITLGQDKSSGYNYGTNKSTSKGTSHTIGDTNTYTPNIISSTIKKFTGGKTSRSEQNTITENENITKGYNEGITEQEGQSISFEQQNGLAVEVEHISDTWVKRIMEGLNSGFWETTVSFATKDKISAKILGGSFIGELSKPSDIIFPPEIFISKLSDGKLLFCPKEDKNNFIFEKSLSSYISTQELSLIASPPTESLPGYEIKKSPELALTDITNNGEIYLGPIADQGRLIKGSSFSLSYKDINKHLFICGLTGSGKTTTLKQILKNITNGKNTPFMVLESAKRDYRQLIADPTFKDNLEIFTIGDATVSPIRFNPFYIQKEIHPLVHIDFLKAIFNASFSLYGPMPHIIEKCLNIIYMKKGWDLTLGTHPNFFDSNGNYSEDKYNEPEHYYCFPTLEELINEINDYISNSGYQGELKDNIKTAIVTRLESLSLGAKGLMFNTYDFYSMEKLLNSNVIFEMENLSDDDDKAFFVGLILVLISEYRQRENPAVNPGRNTKGLQHFLVIEEAHRLLKNVSTENSNEMLGNPKGKAVEMFCNIISEMRSTGQGVAVVEQIPTKISPDVVKNTNTKIVHRLVARDDQSFLSGSLGLSEEDALYLNRLGTGNALCHKEGMDRPIECYIESDIVSHAISDQKINKLMNTNKYFKLHKYNAYEISKNINLEGKEIVVKFLNSFCISPPEKIKDIQIHFKRNINSIELQQNLPLSDTDKVFDYCIKVIFELLSKGIYSKSKKFPVGLYELFKNVLIENQYNKVELIYGLLAEYWNVRDIKEFVINTTGSLVISRFLNDLQRLKNLTSSMYNDFFITRLPNEFECLLIKVIQEKLGEFYDTGLN